MATGDGAYHLLSEGLTQADIDLVVSTVSGTPAGISGLQLVVVSNPNKTGTLIFMQ